MTPHRGKTSLFRSSQQLPRLRLGLASCVASGTTDYSVSPMRGP